VFDIFDLILAA